MDELDTAAAFTWVKERLLGCAFTSTYSACVLLNVRVPVFCDIDLVGRIVHEVWLSV